jgi:hypothetical protein
MKRLLCISAVLLFAFGSSLSAATVLNLGSWELYTWACDPNCQSPTLPIAAIPSYDLDLTSVSGAFVRVTDRFRTGDQFEVFVDGNSVLTTSVPGSIDVATGISDGDAAWANADLSKGEFFLAGGAVYTIDIKVISVATIENFGSGLIRADAIPEPATSGLIALGLLGFGAVARRRKKA